MIKFFRIIRQQLLSQNRFSKYLLYAIGEIILVVIGILIALQINNWNEQKKDRDDEREILSSFKDVMTKDREIIRLSSKFHEGVQNSIDAVLSNLEKESTYNDSLSYHFWNLTSMWVLPITGSVFETLKSKGVELIKNKELRNEIIDFYDIHKLYYLKDQDYYFSFLDHASRNIFNSRFDGFWTSNYNEIRKGNEWKEDVVTSEMTGQMKPIDFEKLKSDLEFKYFLRTLSNRYQAHIKMPTDKINVKITRLIEMIEKELNKK